MKLSTLETIFSSLNRAGVRYLVVGGVAVNIHGYPRMTADLDLVIQLNTDNIKQAMQALGRLGYIPLIPVSAEDFANPIIRNEWINTKNMQVLSLQSDQYPETTVDIFVTEPFDFDSEFEKSERVDLSEEVSLRIVGIAGLINMKQDAARPRDLDDIQHLQIILDESNHHD